MINQRIEWYNRLHNASANSTTHTIANVWTTIKKKEERVAHSTHTLTNVTITIYYNNRHQTNKNSFRLQARKSNWIKKKILSLIDALSLKPKKLRNKFTIRIFFCVLAKFAAKESVLYSCNDKNENRRKEIFMNFVFIRIRIPF